MKLRGSDFLYIALGAGALYLLYKAVGGVSAAVSSAAQLPAQIGTTLSQTLFDWTHPYDPSTDLYYTTNFPDGSRHAIQASTVDASGAFTYNGVGYVMKTDTFGNHVALLAT